MRKVQLLQAIYSSVSKGFLYGAGGEEVSIVSEMDTMLIVESDTGKRFPVRKLDTTYFGAKVQELVPETKVEKPKKRPSYGAPKVGRKIK